MRRRSAVPSCLALLLCAAEGVTAQAVVGRVVDADDARPLDAAFVVLLDEAGNRKASLLTRPDGAFRLRAPGPGRYRVRVERIGYDDVESGVLDVAADSVVRVSLAASARAIELEGLEVEGAARCTVRPAEGELAARLWDEARKTLAVTTWAQDARVLRFRTVTWKRTLDPATLRILEEERQPRTGFHGGSPFVSLPAEDLQANGYVRELEDGAVEYHAPDPSVLLSDPFLDAHCFRARISDPPEEGWVGLVFEPVDLDRAPDIEGVLWLKAATGELRLVEYRYTRLPADLVTDRAGGTLHFDRIPEGPWIVRRWAIRMPLIGLRRRATLDGSRLPRQPYVVGLTETGGEVVAVQAPHASPLIRVAPPVLTGEVFDSVATAPLVGATVRLAGTDVRAVTDSAGRFRMDAPPDGAYTLTFEHARTRALGWTPEGVVVELVPGETTHARLALPPVERILGEACRVPEELDGTAVVLGRVGGAEPAEATIGPPAYLDGVDVVLAWETGRTRSRLGAGGAGQNVRVERDARSVAVTPFADGTFQVCGLPAEEEITLRAERRGRSAGEGIRLSLAPGEIRRVELPLEPAEPVAVDAYILVRDFETGDVVPDVSIRLDEGPWRATGEHGRAVLEGVSPGAHRLELRHVTFGVWSDTVQVRPPGPHHWVVELKSRAIEVEGVTVTVDAVGHAERSLRMVGIDPMSLGRRWISGEDIDAIELKRDVGGILEWQGINGIRVIRPENQYRGEDMGLCVALVRAQAALEVPDGVGGRGRCALVVVDGHRKHPMQVLHMDPETIAAAAVLQPYEATVVFGVAGEAGAVLFWTRQGGR